jgi:hypothetical protein
MFPQGSLNKQKILQHCNYQANIRGKWNSKLRLLLRYMFRPGSWYKPKSQSQKSKYQRGRRCMPTHWPMNHKIPQGS